MIVDAALYRDTAYRQLLRVPVLQGCGFSPTQSRDCNQPRTAAAVMDGRADALKGSGIDRNLFATFDVIYDRHIRAVFCHTCHQ